MSEKTYTSMHKLYSVTITDAAHVPAETSFYPLMLVHIMQVFHKDLSDFEGQLRGDHQFLSISESDGTKYAFPRSRIGVVTITPLKAQPDE